MIKIFTLVFITSCLWQSAALAEPNRYQPVDPQAFHEHHYRLGMQRYAAPAGTSVFIPPQPTFNAPRAVTPPPQQSYNNAPAWHQRANQHQVAQVGAGRTATPRHALRTNNQTPSADTNYIKPWTPAPETADNDLKFGLSVGYRVDELDWNIAGNTAGTSPNILSELTWEDIEMIELRGEADYLINRNALRGIYLEGGFSIAEAFSGDNQDSDYNGDNRTLEFSRSNNDGGDSSASGYHIGIGYQFDLVHNPTQRFFITPLLGYESNTVTLGITDGFQTVDTVGPVELGAFPGLNSIYEAEWSGAYFGLKMVAEMGKHTLNLRGDYHFEGDYYAEAEWNLRTDFVQPLSYIHEGDSEGFALKANYAYRIRPNVELFLNGLVRSFEMEDGLDTTFFSAGGIAQTKLNEVNWTSGSLHTGLRWRF